MYIEINEKRFKSPSGALPIAEEDEIARKMAMLIEGELGENGPARAAAKFGFSRQRYFQLRSLFLEEGAIALLSKKRGPKSPCRRKPEVVCEIVRHRFLDPESSTEAIAQKMRQCGFPIGKRSVDRVIAAFGLQKKTLSVPPPSPGTLSGHLSHPPKRETGKRRSPQH